MTISLVADTATPDHQPNHRSTGRISPFRGGDAAPTAEFESVWADRLAGHVRGRDDGPPRRSAITSLVGALRSGTTINKVLAITAGLTVNDLAIAYAHVDDLRSDSVAALDELIADPTPGRFHATEARIAGLFSQIASVLRPFASGDPDVFAEAVADIGAEADRLAAKADAVESELRNGAIDPRRLITMLDDGHLSGLHHHACYRPRRVGDIVPSRLSDLLGGPVPLERT